MAALKYEPHSKNSNNLKQQNITFYSLQQQQQNKFIDKNDNYTQIFNLNEKQKNNTIFIKEKSINLYNYEYGKQK